MILRNHDMRVGDPSVGEASHTAYHLERACRVQLLATVGHVPIHMPQPVAAEATARRLRAMTQAHCAFFFESCLAMLASDASDWRA